MPNFAALDIMPTDAIASDGRLQTREEAYGSQSQAYVKRLSLS